MDDADTTRTGHSGSRRLLVAAAALVVGGVLVLGVLDGLRARSELLDARSRLTAAQRSLDRAGDAEARLEVADDEMQRALAKLRSARGRMGRVPLRLARAVPGVGNSLETAYGIATAGEIATDAALDVLRELQASADRLRARPGGGALPVDVLQSTADPMQTAARRLAEALDVAAATPSSWLMDEVADAREEFLELLRPSAEAAQTWAAASRVLPSFLGAEEPRRYLLAVSNPAELRGTGGFLGAYSLITISDGRVEFGPFRPQWRLPDLPPEAVEPPHETYLERYRRFGGTGVWANVNLTPDFPSAALALEGLWAAIHGDPVNGTIVVDPFALEGLVRLSGPLELPDGTRLGTSDVVPYLTHESFSDFDSGTERKEVLGEVAALAFERFLSRGISEEALQAMSSLAELVRDGHLLLHSTHPDEQAFFESAGAAGQLPTGEAGDLLAFVLNNAAGNKIDFYLERDLRYDVDLRAEGWARSHLRVELTNHAPSTGRPRTVIGSPLASLDTGETKLLASLFCPVSCVLREPSAAGTPGGSELGHPVIDRWVSIESRQSAVLEYRWDTPDAWSMEEDGSLVYRLRYEHQTMIRDGQLEVVVNVPGEFRFASATVPVTVEDGAVTWSVQPARDQSLELRFVPDTDRQA